MLARVAENLYWLSRYLERAENTVRLINTHSNLLMDLPSIDDQDGWSPLIAINGLEEAFAEQHSGANEQNVCHFLLSDKQNHSSLINAFLAIHFNLRSCRDIMPRISYEGINSLCRFVVNNIDDTYALASKRQNFLRNVEERLLAIAGSMNSNMCHDLGYLVMRMGCYLERADMTSRIIDVQSTRLSAAHATPEILAIQAQRWVSVLRSVVANQMYRQHVRRPVNGPDTLAFLLHDKHLPRSYTFCLDHLETCVSALDNPDSILKTINTLRAQLAQADLPHLARQPNELHVFLDQLQLGMLDVSSAISATYFPPIQETE